MAGGRRLNKIENLGAVPNTDFTLGVQSLRYFRGPITHPRAKFQQMSELSFKLILGPTV